MKEENRLEILKVNHIQKEEELMSIDPGLKNNEDVVFRSIGIPIEEMLLKKFDSAEDGNGG